METSVHNDPPRNDPQSRRDTRQRAAQDEAQGLENLNVTRPASIEQAGQDADSQAAQHRDGLEESNVTRPGNLPSPAQKQ